MEEEKIQTKSFRFLIKKAVTLIAVITGIFILFRPQCAQVQKTPFPFKQFEKYENNLILSPRGKSFERDRVYNPTAIVEGDTIYLIYRAEGRGREPVLLVWQKAGMG